MYILRTLAAVAAGLIATASAHSTQRNPIRDVGRIDDPIIHTQSHRVHAHSSFEISFHFRHQKIRLSLEPNHDILADDATIQPVHPDGTVTSEPINRMDHRIFKGDAFIQHAGHSEWTNAGWARINLHHDGPEPLFEGVFRLDGDHHHIQTSANYLQTKLREDPARDRGWPEYMVIWRDSDIVGVPRFGDGEHQELRRRGLGGEVESCSANVLFINANDLHPIYTGLDVTGADYDLAAVSSKALLGRQLAGTTGGNGAGVNLVQTIGKTDGCFSARKVALVGIATDCTYTAQFAGKSNVTANIIQMVNAASQVYENTFNISLGIHNLTIQNETCPTNPSSTATPWNVDCKSGVTITDRLNLFSKWRGQFNDSNAYWTLLSTCNTDAAVGLAWLGQACTQGSSSQTNETIAGANVVVRTSTEWLVFAHESGHTFGAVHDCTSQTCGDGSSTKQQCCPLSASSCDAGGQFIMNPSTGSGITKFSACSVGNICSAIGRNSVKTLCLTNNRDVVTITGSQGGNGSVESGEDCDCGGAQGCGNNPCCDPKTCKFTSGSVCDFSNEECCTQQCKLAGNGTVCRPSTGQCDPQEVCTGSSPNCPANVNAPDGTGCGAHRGGFFFVLRACFFLFFFF